MLRNKLPSLVRNKLPTIANEYPIKLMLDSGAFTAWTCNTSVSLDAYITFLKKYNKYIDVAINLDSIPGKFGENPSEQETERSAKDSLDNLNKIKSAGLNVLPVFHQGENMKWLDIMIQAGHEYISISASKTISMLDRAKWIESVFRHIDIYNTKTKIHMLGVTTPYLLFKFPFVSSDSVTWSKAASLGTILLPEFNKGKLNYNAPIPRIFISDNNPRTAVVGKHYKTLPIIVKEYIEDYIKEQGFDIEQLKVSWKKRDEFNCKFFMNLQDEVRKHHKTNFIIYFCSAWSRDKNTTLNAAKINNRLLSFYYYKDIYDDKAFLNFKTKGIFIDKHLHRNIL